MPPPPCLSGKQASGGEIDSTLTYVFSTSGTYYLAVDAMDGSCGDFVLTGTWRGPVTAVGSERPFSNRFSLIAWPNPARGVTMRFGRIDSGLRGAGRLLIVDAAGRIVHERHILVGDNAREMSWDGRAANGSHVPPGRYLARVSVGDLSVEAPFVIVN